MKNNIIIFVLFAIVVCACTFQVRAQESCYEQYFREHNKEIFPAIDENDDSYDELKKMALARQIMYNGAAMVSSETERADQHAPSNGMFQPLLLAIDTVTGICHLLSEDGAVLASAHIAMVDSTWYLWLSVDPLVDKYPGNSPYMYCLGNPIIYYDPDGRSTYTNVDGNVTEVHDDNDCGVYRWNPQTEQYDQMGESWHPLSFCDQSKYNEQGIVSPQNMKIDFGSSELGDAINAALSENPSLIQYAKNAKSGGIWDLKAHYTNGSMVNGKYASPRDAGNMLAGAVKYRSGMLAPIVQYGYGAYNLSGNSIGKTAALIIGNIGIMAQNIPVGVSAAILICNGEDKLSQKSINIGYKNIR